MDVERLIEEVRKFHVLYDQTNEKYRNTDYKDRVWKKIAIDLQAKGKIKIIRYFNTREIFIYVIFCKQRLFLPVSRYIAKASSCHSTLPCGEFKKFFSWSRTANAASADLPRIRGRFRRFDPAAVSCWSILYSGTL